jgi:hypothetical protein
MASQAQDFIMGRPATPPRTAGFSLNQYNPDVSAHPEGGPLVQLQP